MADTQLASALEYLKSAKSANTDITVYQHLKDVLQKILEQQPQNPLSILETTLLSTKPDYSISNTSFRQQAAADAAKAVAHLKLFGEPKPTLNEDGEPEEVSEPDEYAYFEPDCPEEAFEQMKLLGQGLSPQESYSVLMAMKKLGGDSELKVEALRFFGKIFGIEGDYYVFECTLAERPEKEEEAEEVAPGEAPAEVETGTNQYMYYVCSYLGGPFTLLDDVTPAQIKAARRLKKLLVGRLDAPVSAYPPFPGTERHYLRAQIARIAHACALCPKGVYNSPEDDEDGAPELNEEYEPLPIVMMKDPANWCHFLTSQQSSLDFARTAAETTLQLATPPGKLCRHHPVQIGLVCGNMATIGTPGFNVTGESHVRQHAMCRRPHIKALAVTVLPEVPEPEDEDSPPEVRPEQTEKGPPALAPASTDAQVEGVPAWTPVVSTCSHNMMHQVAAVRSNCWPGAVALTDGKTWSNVYVGWGVKRQPDYQAPQPPALMQEADVPQESDDLPPPPLREEDEEEED